ncbi:MAG: Wzz/FepE/Etk N-terminal domain-containing protein [Clostridia bacterium]|nr:Wzz/FepE/Etk N-terminal domain-containing protein [Clostridia bacterium]
MALTERDRELRVANVPLNAPDEDAGLEIDLMELLYKLLAKMKYIVAAAILFALIAGVYSFFLAVPMYQSTAKLYVINSRDSAINLADLQIGANLTTDYQEVFKTWEVREMVIQELINLGYADAQDGQMGGTLVLSNPPGTRILNITVTSADAKRAADIANSFAKVGRHYISTMMVTAEPNVLSVALQAIIPVSPNKTQNIMLGFLLGILFAGGIITVQFVLDDKIKTADDIVRYVGVPNLAVVPVRASSEESARQQKAQQRIKERKRA